MKSINTLLLAGSLALSGLVANGATWAASTSDSTVGQYVDDATVTTRVKARFAKDPLVKSLSVSVETVKGEVQLSGFVKSESEKIQAGKVAAAVPDVKSVRNDIVVRADSN